MGYRPTKRSHFTEELLNLNLVPYMNLLLIVIPVLLATASYIQLAIIDVYLPAEAREDTTKEDNEEQLIEPEAKLTLTVFILEEGFTIGGASGILNTSTTETTESSTENASTGPTIGLTSDGKYDYQMLSQKLFEIKKVYPDHSSVILVPNPGIEFDTIIKVMDASRLFVVNNEQKTLFPNVAIAGEVL